MDEDADEGKNLTRNLQDFRLLCESSRGYPKISEYRHGERGHLYSLRPKA